MGNDPAGKEQDGERRLKRIAAWRTPVIRYRSSDRAGKSAHGKDGVDEGSITWVRKDPCTVLRTFAVVLILAVVVAMLSHFAFTPWEFDHESMTERSRSSISR